MKAVRRLCTVVATQWFKDGDHPQVSGLPNPNPNITIFGWLKTHTGCAAVRPSDWVIEDEFGDFRVLSDDKFKKLYEEVT